MEDILGIGWALTSSLPDTDRLFAVRLAISDWKTLK